MDYWNQSAEAILERWAIHEEWALAVKDQEQLPVFSFRFEDLCENPVEIMRELFEFLNLGANNCMVEQIESQTKNHENDKYRDFPLTFSERALTIMERFGYVP